MSEDPKDPKMPDPAGEDQAPGMAPSQPPEPSQAPDPSQKPGPSPDAPKPQGGDYVTEIRSSLQRESLARRTGSLIRRLTGSLRRVTGPLRPPTGPLPDAAKPPSPPAETPLPAPLPDEDQPEAGRKETPKETGPRQLTGPLSQMPGQPLQPSVAPGEATDDFLAGRLGAAAGPEPGSPPQEDLLSENWFESDEEEEAGEEASFLVPLFTESEPTPPPAPLAPSAPLSEPEIPAQPEATPAAPDWMAEMRQEQAGPQTAPPAPPEAEQPPAEEPVSSGSGSLKSITGSLFVEPVEFYEEEISAVPAPGTGPLLALTPAGDQPPAQPPEAAPLPAALEAPAAADALQAAKPEEPVPSEPAPAPQEEPAKEGDYVDELRQTLRSESLGHKTGSLIRRITNSLRRVTGSLRLPTGALPPEAAPAQPETPEQPAQPEEPLTPAEVADGFVVERLSGATAEEPRPVMPEEEGFPEGWFDTVHEEAREGDDSLESLFANAEIEEQPESTSILSELGMPVEQEAEAPEPDWMAEIRQSAAEEPPALPEPSAAPVEQQLAPPKPEQPPQEPPQEEPARGSGPLSFITGILRGSERRKKRKQTGSLSDAMVTGRLERSLGTAPMQPPEPEAPAPPAAEQPLDLQAPPVEQAPIPFDELFFGDTGTLKAAPGVLETPAGESADQGEGILEEPLARPDTGSLFADEELVIDKDATLLEGLESRFDQFGEPQEAGPSEAAPEAREISAEEGAGLWSSEEPEEGAPAEGLLFAPEDVWGEEELPAVEQPGSRAPNPVLDDALAASFLTGEDVLPELNLFSQDQLLREALERSPDEEEGPTIEEMRAIALQGYQEPDRIGVGGEILTYRGEPSQPPAGAAEQAAGEDSEAEKSRAAAAEATAAAVAAFEREESAGAPFSLSRWLASRTLVQKFLLVEAAVVALAVLIAVPFFIYLIARGPAQKQVVMNYPSPVSLPAGVPYPTGIQLPGGWTFRLEKSTFVQGQWAPATSEWLEGTELRRVVALPWNPQTQAVVNTFQPGDKVYMSLSNGETVAYTVDTVERVTANNTQILSDPTPSLVIILYQESSSERWVVFCKP